MWRHTILVAVVVLLALPSLAEAQKSTKTKGYVKKSTGMYVAPSYRTKPNRTKADNYSSKPNVNPYTGKKGTRDPYAPKKKSSRRKP